LETHIFNKALQFFYATSSISWISQAAPHKLTWVLLEHTFSHADCPTKMTSAEKWIHSKMIVAISFSVVFLPCGFFTLRHMNGQICGL